MLGTSLGQQSSAVEPRASSLRDPGNPSPWARRGNAAATTVELSADEVADLDLLSARAGVQGDW